MVNFSFQYCNIRGKICEIAHFLKKFKKIVNKRNYLVMWYFFLLEFESKLEWNFALSEGSCRHGCKVIDPPEKNKKHNVGPFSLDCLAYSSSSSWLVALCTSNNGQSLTYTKTTGLTKKNKKNKNNRYHFSYIL